MKGKRYIGLIFVFFITSMQISAQDLKDYLIAYWSFNNSSCTDYSGNNNHGIPVNNPTYVIDGISGKAIHFEGKGYYIAINDDVTEIGSHVLLPKIDFNKLDEFTISLWIRFKDFSHWPSGEAYIFWGHHNNGWLGVFNHIFEYQMNGKMINSFAVGAKLWNNLVEEDFQESFKNNWVHYALVYSKGNVKGYLNGNFIGQISQQVSIIGTNAALARHWWYYNGEERTSARFTGDMDEVKIFRKALTMEEINNEISDCSSWLSYKNFTNTTSLILNGSAMIDDSILSITKDIQNDVGSLWYAYKLPVNVSFKNEFSFKYKGGNNDSENDGSLPGADGIAFVIQNHSINALGWDGGYMGYTGIKDAVAFEFDTYHNKSDEINDPNGNHAAINISDHNGILRARHSFENTLALNDSLTLLKEDVVYHCLIKYDYPRKRLNVYLDESYPIDTLIFNINNFNLPNLVNNKEFAIMGFTSSTGKAFAKHYLLNWDLCYEGLSFFSVKDDKNKDSDNVIYPNPAYDYIELEVSESIEFFEKIEIFNYLGIKCSTININEINCCSNKIKIPINGLPQGFYFINIESSTKNYFGKFIKK